MKKFILGVVIGILIVVGVYYGKRTVQNYIFSRKIVSPIGKILEKPLEKYSVLRLSGRVFTGSQITLDQPTATTSAYTVYPFHFLSDGKKVTGVAHIPNKNEKFPVIVQFRGYADREKYTPGEGTRRSAEVYATNGYISLAPDFLGYGGSDMPSQDIFEERFETYTTALNLLASIKTLSMADPDRIGVWGHSNGGQIALTVLEILGTPIPATLWAPVSKPFPYSILYYTDDADDHGKLLRKRLADFEKEHDTELYSLTNYVDRITGPVQLHQGDSDESVPEKWSEELVKRIPGINYFTYPGVDHNMVPDWNTVVMRDVTFFDKYLR
jgi:dipeptidyl aminopeptidase/acylaminoacyl peptidase